MARYFRIGELAKLYHLNADTLRYYEEQGMVSPARAANGYRLYSPQDVWRLNVIRDLRQLGVPLDAIGEHLKKHSALSTLQLLEAEEALLEKQLHSLQEMAESVRRRKQTLLAALHTPVGQIETKTLDPRPCYRINKGYRTDEEMDVLIQQLMSMDEHSLYLLGNDEIGSFVSLPAALEGTCREYDGVFALHKNGKYTIPGGEGLPGLIAVFFFAAGPAQKLHIINRTAASLPVMRFRLFFFAFILRLIQTDTSRPTARAARP